MKTYLWILLATQCAIVVGCSDASTKNMLVFDRFCETIQVPDNDSFYSDFDSALNFSEFIILKPDPKVNTSSLSDVFSIKRIVQASGKFFVLDIKYMTANVFDQSGKYLFTFNKIGKGLGGSSFLLDLFIDQRERAAYLVSNSPNKLLKYSLEGVLDQEYFPPFYPSSMSRVGGKYLFDLNFNYTKYTGKNNFLVTDTAFQIMGKSFSYEMEEDQASYLYHGGIFTIDDSLIYYTPGKSNAIYRVQDNVLEAAYYFRFPQDTAGVDLTRPNLRAQNDCQMVNRFYKYGDFIAINYTDSKNRKTCLCLYNVKNRQFFRSKTMDLFENAMVHQSGDKMIIGLNVRKFLETLKSKMSTGGTYPSWYKKVLRKIESEQIDNSTIAIIICSIA
jgi:hypothetical protein